ncbi:YkgJ family cysteine cluster protein [Proteobacteria bacterium 005FR1]|nr:YkgJ family cysteine cluster protein [Proteobacteria bacterium 005FR1]
MPPRRSATKVIASDSPEYDQGDNKCSRCKGAKCCQYVTERITTPRSIADFDYLLWQISHKLVHMYKDCEGWTLLFLSECQHLLSSGMCGIYEKRPLICREHSNDYCEFDISVADSAELYFRDYSDLDAYCRQRFKNWDKRYDKLATQ